MDRIEAGNELSFRIGFSCHSGHLRLEPISTVERSKNTSEPSLTPKLSKARKRLYDTAIRLGELQAHFKVRIDPEEYARDNLKFGLVEVVYEWAKGTPFADICELTDVPEGRIIKTWNPVVSGWVAVARGVAAGVRIRS